MDQPELSAFSSNLGLDLGALLMGNVPPITLNPTSFFSQGHKFQSFDCKIVLIHNQVAKVKFLFHKELEIKQK